MPNPDSKPPRATSISDAPYPAAVSLVNDEKHGWTFRQSVTDLPLYTSDKDPPGKSICNDACAATWIPVSAPEDASPLGEWSIILRKDNHRQWAFRHHPVYTLIGDSIGKAGGNGRDGSWHLLPYMP